ncbi:PREDICTED: beta-1,4-galactosyltransferase 3 [Nipponia nippon]|uniref:beta-1,4-galactosyltransferase 3 n=1 Tax=Nipponia nippon TaxID=128390 RepID=UPI0005111E88|nr:PREDICTED: beta-1,4-galactosyltransferase 3 [Nipponia nippon]
MKYFWFNSPAQLLILRTDRQTGGGGLAIPGPLSEHSPVPGDRNEPRRSPLCPGEGPCQRCRRAVVVPAAYAAVADVATVGAGWAEGAAPGIRVPPPRASPLPPPRAVGPLTVSFSRVPTLEQIQAKNPAVREGGRYQPSTCEPRSRTAVIIPHRNRETHLGHLLYYLHPFLQRQQLQYGIYVVHQAGNSTFNRAKLLNVGVKEALKDEEWDCLFLHDVDLIPENDHNLYTCDPWNPKHVSIAMNKFGYSLPYPQYFGGVSALTPDQYMKINGFPNEYWGWGGEDDDIATRVRLAGMKIARPPISIGHYKMVKHKSDKGNEENPHSAEAAGEGNVHLESSAGAAVAQEEGALPTHADNQSLPQGTR